MPEENTSPSSSVPRTGKQPRSRTSPPPGSGDQPSEGRPTKRARKAINCLPCRNSKLKCDRNRPCSSCVLRGTSALCYQDDRGYEGPPSNHTRGDNSLPHGYIDTNAELAKARQSLNLIEQALNHQRHAALSVPRVSHDPTSAPFPKSEAEVDSPTKSAAPPGMLSSKDNGSLYTGPTSTTSHLMTGDNRESEEAAERPAQELSLPTQNDYDSQRDIDLLERLPSWATMDELVAYYFDYCNWIYRHVNQPSFMESWNRAKVSGFPDRIVLATVCIIMAVAVHYLPAHHTLFENSTENHDELGERYYNVMRIALQRHQAESRQYTLELVELILIKSHFLTLSKKESEEIWIARGELLTIGLAMGLHRDPGRWRMPLPVAERRRWAWWHIILLERWQAFMFGRPIGIASDHFDTELPSYCDPAVDSTGRLYLPNIALFRLAYTLGGIMNDALSIRPIPYENIQRSDRALKAWTDELPRELDMDEYRIARSLASPNAAIRRLGVQSVIIRSSFYHIHFTLHRPYAGAPAPTRSGKEQGLPRVAQSLDTAVSAADKLITIVGQAQPELFNNEALAVPGHMNWGPFHVFSASMFFSFQLIANPEQPGANVFRANIRKAMVTLEQCQDLPLARKAWDILHALTPLYAPEFLQRTTKEREKEKANVLSIVKNLAFPYHDSPTSPRGAGDSPSVRPTLSSPANSTSLSPPGMGLMLPQQHTGATMNHSQTHSHNLPPMSSIRSIPPNTQQQLPSLAPYTHPPPPPPPGLQHISGPSHMHPHSHTHSQQLSPPLNPPNLSNLQQPTSSSSYPPPQYQMPQQSIYSDSRYQSYVHPADEGVVFGASAGIGMGEWQWFRDYTQRADPTGRPGT